MGLPANEQHSTSTADQPHEVIQPTTGDLDQLQQHTESY